MPMNLRSSRDRLAPSLLRAVLGVLVFVAARWVLQRTPVTSNIPELLIVGAIIFFAAFV
jgi:hypothetical protein